MRKKFITVLSGTAVAQLCGFLALPVFTRLFDTEAFGIAQIYQTTLTVLLCFAAMRYEYAILTASSGKELITILHICIFVNIAVTLVVILGCFIVSLYVENFKSLIQIMLWYLPLGVLFGGILQSLGNLLIREKDFITIASSKIMQSSGYVLSGFGIGYAFANPIGLIIADNISKLIAILPIFKQHYKSYKLFSGALSSEKLLKTAYKFRKFPLIAMPGGLINLAGGGITTFFLMGIFNISTVGQYALAERALMLPVAMIGNAMAQIFTADLSEKLRDNKIEEVIRLFFYIIKKIFIIGILPTILIVFFSPFIFVNIFGEQWTMAGELARVLAPLALISLMVTPVNMMIVLIDKQKIQLYWEIFRLITVVMMWSLIYTLKFSLYKAIFLYVTNGILVYSIFLILIYISLKLNKVKPPSN